MQLYFIRHGFSVANQKMIIANRGFSYPLTELGFQQAHALTQTLNDIKPTAIYSSPLKRAVQTAEVLGKYHHQNIIPAPSLREYDNGVFEGKSGFIAWMQFLIFAKLWDLGAVHAKPNGGESLMDIKNRFFPLIEHLKNTYPEESTIFLVGHGGTFGRMLPMLAENLSNKFCRQNRLKNTEFALLVNKTNQTWQCLKWGSFRF